MSKEPRWLSKVAVRAIHEKLLAEHGGARGVLDDGILESALAAPRNRYLYERSDIFRLAATYAHAITRDHPFGDGNKRVALTLAGVFLELNGYQLTASEGEAVSAMVALVERRLDEEAFAAWLEANSARPRTRVRGRQAPAPRRPRAKKRSTEEG